MKTIGILLSVAYTFAVVHSVFMFLHEQHYKRLRAILLLCCIISLASALGMVFLGFPLNILCLGFLLACIIIRWCATSDVEFKTDIWPFKSRD